MAKASDKQMTAEDFFSGLASKKKVLAEAAKATPAGFLSDAQIMEVFGLRESDKTVDFDFVKVSFGIDKNKKKYLRFNYVVTSEEFQGTQISELVTIDMTDDEALLKSMKRAMITIQKLGIETRHWEASNVLDEVQEAIATLNQSKPSGQMTLSIYSPPKKNPKDKPKEYLNKNILRVTHEGPGAENDDEDNPVAAVDYAALGDAADNDDAEAQEVLTAQAKVVGLPKKDFDTMSWAEVAQYIIDNSGQEEEEEEEEEEESSTEVDDNDPATWIGLTAIYDGEEVELKSYNARKGNFEAYASESDATYTVKPDDLDWPS